MKKIFVIMIVLICFGALFAQKVQNFTFEDSNGKKIILSDLTKKGIVVLDFWATSCGPCMKSLPALNKLTEKYRDVSFIAISCDSPKSKDKVLKTIKSQKFQFIVGIDGSREVQKIFNVTSIPMTFIINAKGEIVYQHPGYVPGDEKKIEEEILKFKKGSEK